MVYEKEPISRRDFVRGVGASAAISTGIISTEMLPESAEAAISTRKVGANDKITLALIGCGGMGVFNMTRFMEKPEVEIAAVCDVDSNHLNSAANIVEKKYGKRPYTYSDYRMILDRKDIDGVIIATPDHWHALPLIHACEAGKDAYCEKPISHDITEARSMMYAVKRYNRIVQVGTWQRSIQEFMSAVSYIRSGRLGKITMVRAWKTDTSRVGNNESATPPSTLDYNRWVGPAAMEPFRGEKTLHFNWRWFLNYGSGMTGDWGVHMIDIALLAMSKGADLVMPTEVSSFGGKWAYPEDDRTAPDTVITSMKFSNPDFVLQWDTQRNHPDRPDQGVEFIAADGSTLMVWRRGWRIRDVAGRDIPKVHTHKTNDHWQNWLDCLKTRRSSRSNLLSLAQTTMVCHLANVSLLAGETIRWDKSQYDIVGRTGKNTQSYEREYRKPWKLPIYGPHS